MMFSPSIAPAHHYYGRNPPRDLDYGPDLSRPHFSSVDAQSPLKGVSAGTRAVRAFTRFVVAILIGVGLTLAWQFYGDEAKQLVRTSAPSLAWLVPGPDATAADAAANLNDLVRQMKLIAVDVAILQRSLGQIFSNQDQLMLKQDRLTHDVAALQALEQDVRDKIASPPRVARPQPQNPNPPARP